MKNVSLSGAFIEKSDYLCPTVPFLMSFWRKLEEERFETWKEIQNKSWKLEKKNERKEVQSKVISGVQLN